MKKLVISILLSLILTVCIYAIAENSITVLFDDGAHIETQAVGGNLYLFLPSGADITALPLIADEGSTITGNKGTASLDGNVDLTGVIGNVEAGVLYSVNVKENGRQYKLYVILSSGVRTLFITLDDAERKWLDESKDNKAEGGKLTVFTAEGVLEQTVKIKSMKARGNASFTNAPRKSYSVNLSKSAELISGAGSTKKWALVANDVQANKVHDNTGIGNFTSYTLYRELGGAYALSNESVDVYINGEYRGMYTLVEKVTISENSVNIAKASMDEDKDSVTRVVGTCGLYLNGKTVWVDSETKGKLNYTLTENVTTVMYETSEQDEADPAIAAGVRAYQYATGSTVEEAGGILLDIEFRIEDEVGWFVTRRGAAIAISAPEYPSKEQVQEIAIYIQGFEDALYSVSGYNASGRHYSEYCDMDSMIKYLSVEMFTANVDILLASAYMSCDRAEDGSLALLTFGPIWDSDFCLLYSTGLVYNYKSRYYWTDETGTYMYYTWVDELIRKPLVLNEIKRVWTEEFSGIVQNFTAYTLEEYASGTDAPRRLTAYLSNDGRSVYNQVTAQKDGLKNRVSVFNNVWTRKLLKEVVITEENGTLKANAEGSIERIRWYSINEDWSAALIESAKGKSYTPVSSGMYVAEFYGTGVQDRGLETVYSEVYVFEKQN